jgi:large subunit ribosomal protein L17
MKFEMGLVEPTSNVDRNDDGKLVTL